MFDSYDDDNDSGWQVYPAKLYRHFAPYHDARDELGDGNVWCHAPRDDDDE